MNSSIQEPKLSSKGREVLAPTPPWGGGRGGRGDLQNLRKTLRKPNENLRKPRENLRKPKENLGKPKEA